MHVGLQTASEHCCRQGPKDTRRNGNRNRAVTTAWHDHRSLSGLALGPPAPASSARASCSDICSPPQILQHKSYSRLIFQVRKPTSLQPTLAGLHEPYSHLQPPKVSGLGSAAGPPGSCPWQASRLCQTPRDRGWDRRMQPRRHCGPGGRPHGRALARNPQHSIRRRAPSWRCPARDQQHQDVRFRGFSSRGESLRTTFKGSKRIHRGEQARFN